MTRIDPRSIVRRLIAVTFIPLGLLATSAAQSPTDSSRGTIESGGFRLGYRIEGEGPPVLVIGSSVYYPRIFSQNLRQHLRLIFVDHRGFAPSPGDVDVSAFDLDKIVDDIEKVRQTLGLGRVAVIGHSGHAYMALEYAKKYPKNVSHVVMIGIAPDLSAASWAAAQRSWQESVDPERKAALAANMKRLSDEVLAALTPAERFVQDYVRQGPRSWYDFRFDPTPLWAGVEVNAKMFDHVWGKVFRDIDITKGLANFDRPVFLALGRYDYVVAPPSSWDSLRPRFQNLTVRLFERSGHTPPLEEPALFDAELLRWLAKNR